MALSPVNHAAHWAEEIAEVAREFFDGELEVRRVSTPGTYNPVTGEYGADTPGEVVLSRRPARAQHLSSPNETNDGNSWQTSRRYRFQCDIREGDGSVTKGLVVRFFGGRDPEVPKMVFQVDWATNSSHAAIRTIECSTEGARVHG